MKAIVPFEYGSPARGPAPGAELTRERSASDDGVPMEPRRHVRRRSGRIVTDRRGRHHTSWLWGLVVVTTDSVGEGDAAGESLARR